MRCPSCGYDKWIAGTSGRNLHNGSLLSEPDRYGRGIVSEALVRSGSESGLPLKKASVMALRSVAG
jgi:hypothetical protein